jgi:uncharacterized repeat protein (TIGR04052 family)
VINFGARVADAPFECGTAYSDIGTPARTAEPVDFRFYVYDVRLLTSLGNEVAVELDDDDVFQTDGVAMIDFEDGTGACNEGDAATNTELRGKAPAGEYTGIKFRIGVPQSINHADLTTQASPLNKSSLYWGWAMGHVFFAAVSRTMVDIVDEDGGVDDTDGGTGTPGINLHTTHVGATGCDGNPMGGEPVTQCASPNRAEITLPNFDHEAQTIIADFAEVKRGSDIAAGAGCHSFTANTCTAPFLRLGLSFATGEASGLAQTVFSVE